MVNIKSFILFIICVLLINQNTFAQLTRYQQSVRGGFTLVANALDLTSSTFAKTDGGTSCSSYADLVLPPGSTIVKAILYVDGFATTLGIGGAMKKITSVKFKVPGSSTYTTLGTSTAAGFIANPITSGNDYTQYIYDVTSLMPANGYVSSVTAGGNAATTGRYSIADPAPLVTSNYGYGWAIYVVYTNPVSRFRSITIADAQQDFSSSVTAAVNITNIPVPSAGSVGAMVAITGCWGDIDGSSNYKDYASFGQTGGALIQLTDPTTSSNTDIMNSTIGVPGVNNVSVDAIAAGAPIPRSGNVTSRNPYNTFTQTGAPTAGAWYSCNYDADMLDASGILPNSTTPINVTFKQSEPSGSIDALASGAYGVSVDIAASLLTKSISPSSIMDGGTATYTWTIDNTVAGALNLAGIGFVDNLPSNLKVASPNGAVITGGSGGTITATPGAGSITLSGLNLNIGQTAKVSVNVTNVPGQLNPSCSANPAAFTNSFANIFNNTANLSNGVVPQCLLVLPVAVPVELLYFKAEQLSGKIQLMWQTASEQNSAYFIVERSIDGLTFNEIGKVQAAGNSTKNLHYELADNNPYNGLNYYRLKQVDLNGKFQYSAIVIVTNANTAPVITTNNSSLVLQFESNSSGPLQVNLFNMNGTLLKNQEYPTNNGFNNIAVDISSLIQGIYIVEISCNGQRSHHRFVKL